MTGANPPGPWAAREIVSVSRPSWPFSFLFRAPAVVVLECGHSYLAWSRIQARPDGMVLCRECSLQGRPCPAESAADSAAPGKAAPAGGVPPADADPDA